MSRFKKWISAALGLAATCITLTGVCGTTVQAAGERATAADVVQATADNKKGIQGVEYAHGTHTDPEGDPWGLGVKHTLFNIELEKMIKTDGSGLPYTYNGETYYFDYDGYIKPFEWRIKELRDHDTVVTLVILMGWSDDPQLKNLIYPDGRVKDGHYYYALNSGDAQAKKLLDASFHFLTDVFGQKDCFVQNWVMGNELNIPEEYNYSGTVDLDTNVSIAVNSFNLLYNAIQDNSPYSKAYISLTNHWNYVYNNTGMTSKSFMDLFASRMQDKNWNVAFHAYPPDMATPCWSREAAKDLKHDITSRYVCGANLEVLTDYVKNTYGTSHRIILSEQGFDANVGLNEQAAMLAYTYYAAARNDMIDAAIFFAWSDLDQGTAGNDGYNLGLLDSSNNPRPAYSVFKYMDTPQASSVVDRYLATLGVQRWTDDIIYQVPPTNAVLTSTSLYVHENSAERIKVGMTYTTSEETDVEFRWTAEDASGNVTVLDEWTLNHEWTVWTPPQNGRYVIRAQARVAGNHSSNVNLQTVVYFNMPVTAVVTDALLVIEDVTNDLVKAKVNATASEDIPLEYKWYAIQGSNTIPITDDWVQGGNTISWVPTGYGNFGIIADVRIVGAPSTERRANVEYVDIYAPAAPTNAVITEGHFFWVEQNKSRICVAADIQTSEPTVLEYRFIETHKIDGNEVTTIISPWKRDYQWLDWQNPQVYGEVKIKAEVRVAGNPSSTWTDEAVFTINPHIKGMCQMPLGMLPGHEGEDGYLIGVESFENPNQEYYYEMLILDCTLLAEGRDAWVYTTGKYRVSEGNAGWTIWQPQYGYYWTLFRVYDAQGKMIDEACYGFVNAY